MPIGKNFTEFRFLIQTLKAGNDTIHSTGNLLGVPQPSRPQAQKEIEWCNASLGATAHRSTCPALLGSTLLP